MPFPKEQYFQLMWKNTHVFNRIGKAFAFILTGKIHLELTPNDMDSITKEFVRRRELLK